MHILKESLLAILVVGLSHLKSVSISAWEGRMSSTSLRQSPASASASTCPMTG